jgi:hypothetical protein
VQPVQPPIHPNYETFKHMQQQRTNPDSEVWDKDLIFGLTRSQE